MAGRHAYVDESFRDRDRGRGIAAYYQLAAVILAVEAAGELRAAVEPFGVAGSFKASTLARDGRRDLIRGLARAFAASDPGNAIVVAIRDHALPQERARQACLERLLVEVQTCEVTRVVLDSRESVVGPDPEIRNAQDLRTQGRMVRQGQLSSAMRLVHRHDSDDHLLWLPDAVGWIHRRHLLMGDSGLWETISGRVHVVMLE